VETLCLALEDDAEVAHLTTQILDRARSMQGTRRLFILHYAGHAIGAATCDNLIITSKISHCEINESSLNMTLIKNYLKDLASRSSGLDILLMMDCCCASISSQGMGTVGETVELMAATSSGGLSNQRQDGKTFTERWCEAFENFLSRGGPFDCDDIFAYINFDLEGNLE
jgi:Caspase domain